MKIIPIFQILLAISFFGQIMDNSIYGTYASSKNKFERWSTMTLNPGNEFIYEYGVGGCQAEVTGTWWIENKRIKFRNDIEFSRSYFESQESILLVNDTLTIDMGTPIYPDLGQVDWIYKKGYIKPVAKIDTGCLTVEEKPKKK